MSNQPAPTKYQVKIVVPGYFYPPASWNCRRDGRPTAANLAKFVESFEASTQPGQCNAHLGVTKVLSASVKLNDGSAKVVARYEMPIFVLQTTGKLVK